MKAFACLLLWQHTDVFTSIHKLIQNFLIVVQRLFKNSYFDINRTIISYLGRAGIIKVSALGLL